jgi:hypothetical protein
VKQAGAHVVGQLGELLRDFLGDLVGGLAGAERVGIGEGSLEQIERRRISDVEQRKAVDFLGRVREVGVDFEAVQVADDEQRRVFQVFAIKLKLLVRFVEVPALFLVFPGEMAL